MLIPIPNAFSLNTVGTAGAPFPFAVDVTWHDWGSSLSLTALRLADAADVLGRALLPYVLICEAGHYVFEAEGSDVTMSLSEVARRSELECSDFDVGWALHRPVRPAMEAISIKPSQVGALAATYFYNLELLDSADQFVQARVDDVILRLRTAESRAIIGDLPWATTRFSGHDDCYVLLETCHPHLVEALIGRTIALFTGTILDSADLAPTVQPPAESVVQQLLAASPRWVAHPRNASISREGVEIPLAAQPWRLGDPPSQQVDGTLSYRLESGSWHLSL